MLSIGMTAMTSGDPPSGSRHDPTTLPPSLSTRVTTSRISADEASKRQSNASSPFVFGVALRDARLRLAAGFAGIDPFRINHRTPVTSSTAHTPECRAGSRVSPFFLSEEPPFLLWMQPPALDFQAPRRAWNPSKSVLPDSDKDPRSSQRIQCFSSSLEET